MRRASAKFVQGQRLWKDFSFDTNIRVQPIEPVEFSFHEEQHGAQPARPPSVAAYTDDCDFDFSKVNPTPPPHSPSLCAPALASA